MSDGSIGRGAEIIGRYALHGVIATGETAVVYVGKLIGPAGLARPVAIKRVRPSLAREPAVRDALRAEGRLTARIRHANVVSTLDVATVGDELLVVQEYILGVSLRSLLRELHARAGRAPVPMVLALICGVLRGIDAAHEAGAETGEEPGVARRRVSPGGVLCGADGTARISDYGAARVDAVRADGTYGGGTKGEVAYVAPERLRGERGDRRADVYSAAVMLWEMLAGRPAGADGVSSDHIEAPSMYAPEIPKLLDAITLHGLARDPEQRFATAAELAAALEQLGDFASPSDVSQWLEGLAGESLARRREQWEEVEKVAPVPRQDAGGTASTPRSTWPLPDLLAPDLGEAETDPGTGRSRDGSFPIRLLRA
jgi:serine/threonine-protein kinase